MNYELTSPTNSSPRRIGLLAGWGRFPFAVAEALRRQGYLVYGLGVKDHADPALKELCEGYAEVGVARLGAAIRRFRGWGVTEATMAGKIFKTLMFRRLYWLRHLPDWTCVKHFYPHFVTRTKDRRDDTLLGAVVQLYAQEGIHFAPATDFAPELLVKSGTLTKRQLTSAQRRDVEFGWRLAKEMGRLDVGQSVAVAGRAVLAVEAVEGTDACILRAGELCPRGGFTVVKVAKPQQDMRFDVPTIGVKTLETMVQAGAAVLAVEAQKTIIIDEHDVIRFADRHRLAIVAVQANG